MAAKIDFEKLTEVLTEAFTLYQSAVMAHGVKDLAHELKKSKTTVYAEMSLENLMIYLETIENYDDQHKKPSYLPKQGLVDFIIGILISGDTRPFVALASFFNMACFKVPETTAEKADILQLLQRLNTEYSEGVNETLGAVKDNKINLSEAKKNIKELMDIINAAGAMKSFYENIIKGKS